MLPLELAKQGEVVPGRGVISRSSMLHHRSFPDALSVGEIVRLWMLHGITVHAGTAPLEIKPLGKASPVDSPGEHAPRVAVARAERECIYSPEVISSM
jgi:hypothetical protein